MALTKIGLKILKDSFRTIISGSFRGELSSSASTFVGGGVSGSSTSTGSFGRVEAAGGTVYQPKTQISPEHGYMAVFIDTEGNRVALHSRS